VARERVILALDRADPEAVEKLLAQYPDIHRVKVGLELFTAQGPQIVAQLKQRGLWVFLDLKLHDIPNTVASAVRAAVAHGVDLLTVHALGGSTMIEAAVKARDAANGALDIVAVTALTSHDAAQWRVVVRDETPADAVQRLADMAVAAGADGVVCSPHEVAALRTRLGSGPLAVVPGIRFGDVGAGDQRRAAGPAAALRAGASHLVVGRALTAAVDPPAAWQALVCALGEANVVD